MISSVLSPCSKSFKWRASVIALLQVSFIWQAKKSTPSRPECGLTQKERPQSVLASSFYSFIRTCPMQIGLAKNGMFVSPEVLTPVHGLSSVLFLQAFPFLCVLAANIWTPFSYYNYLTLASHSYTFKMYTVESTTDLPTKKPPKFK